MIIETEYEVNQMVYILIQNEVVNLPVISLNVRIDLTSKGGELVLRTEEQIEIAGRGFFPKYRIFPTKELLLASL